MSDATNSDEQVQRICELEDRMLQAEQDLLDLVGQVRVLNSLRPSSRNATVSDDSVLDVFIHTDD